MAGSTSRQPPYAAPRGPTHSWRAPPSSRPPTRPASPRPSRRSRNRLAPASVGAGSLGLFEALRYPLGANVVPAEFAAEVAGQVDGVHEVLRVERPVDPSLRVLV